MTRLRLPIALLVAGSLIILGGVVYIIARQRSSAAAADDGTVGAQESAENYAFGDAAAEGRGEEHVSNGSDNALEMKDESATAVPQGPFSTTPLLSVPSNDTEVTSSAPSFLSSAPSFLRSGYPSASPSSLPTQNMTESQALTRGPTRGPTAAPTVGGTDNHLFFHHERPPQPMPPVEVIIIGAGAAGLSASYTLRHHGATSVRILEASDTLGGRARKDTTFTNGTYPLDVGPSFIKYYGAIRRIVEPDLGGRDLMEYPEGTGLPTFVNYSYWDFFNDYIAPKDAGVIQYNCRVNKVDYTQGQIIETACADGRTFASEYVIVTVPLPILNQQLIDFTPPLPTSMTVNHPGQMWQGIKVFIEFRKNYFGDSFCLREIVRKYDGSCLNYKGKYDGGENLFWEYSSGAPAALGNGNVIVAGFILGDQSHDFIDKDEDEIAENVLKLLDKKFKGRASKFYVRHMIVNWSKDPHTLGTLSSWGYDRPGSGNPSGAVSVGNDRVFVAGEAFPVDGSNGWVDAGAFSGDDAAKRILELSRGIEEKRWFWRLVRESLGR